MIIETTDNRFYRVTEAGDENLQHVWYGLRVKRTPTAGVWKVMGKRKELVRKEGCRVVDRQPAD